MEPMIATPEREALRNPAAELVLNWRGQELHLSSQGDTCLSIGLHRDNDVVVSGTYVSKKHATLLWRRNRFELVDHSTNGSFVQHEDEQISHVHRDAIRLWGSGFLSLGEPLTNETAIHFSHG